MLGMCLNQPMRELVMISNKEATHVWVSNQRSTDSLVLAALEKALPLDRMP
jgi:hypothetical protein